MPRSGSKTRARLLDAAELLFADHGINGVTVSEITATAGARNKSAVAYHFGSKFGLLEAVLARHVPDVDEHRDALLDRLDTPESRTPTALAEALVLPVAAKLDTPSGARFLQVQADLLGYPQRAELPPDLHRPWTRPPLARVRQMATEQSPPLPSGPSADHIQLLLSSLVYHSLADYARTRTTDEPPDRDLFVRTLVAAVIAILDPPLAAQVAIRGPQVAP